MLRSAPQAGSPLRDERLRGFTTQWLDQLGSVDFDRLSQDGKVDYLLLKNHLAHELRQVDIRARERAEWEPLVPFAPIILELDGAKRALKPMEWSKVAGDLIRLTKEIGDARRTLERTGPGRDQSKGKPLAKSRAANRALSAVEGLRNTLRTWFAFYDGYDPLFTWWMQEPYKAADQSLQSYAGLPPPALRRLGVGFRRQPRPRRRSRSRGRGGRRFRWRYRRRWRYPAAAVSVAAVLPAAPARGNSPTGEAPRRPPIGTARSSAHRSAATPCSAS